MEIEECLALGEERIHLMFCIQGASGDWHMQQNDTVRMSGANLG